MRSLALSLALLLGACNSAGNWNAPAGQDWPSFGGNWTNQRYSSLTDINRATISKLGAVWKAPIAGSRATPIVEDGVMYIPAASGVFALDAATGAERWHWKPDQGLATSKGVALGQGLVYVALDDTSVVALDRKSGAPLWRQRIGYPPEVKGQNLSSAPIFAEGLVLIGLVSADNGFRGYQVALDAATGREVWRFYVIPGPGEFGHDTWPDDETVWNRGGGGLWTMPAVDPELGLVYFGVGNAVPQLGGSVRPGDNLFTASALALDLKTGKYRWHFQMVHHDIWDADAGTSLVLYDVTMEGRKRKGVAAMRTDGVLFLLDRATGQPLIPVEERKVPQNAHLKTSPTQPYPVGADQVGPNCVEPDRAPPGFKLGCYWDPVDHTMPNLLVPLINTRGAPMAQDPTTGLIYVAAGATATWLRAAEDPWFFQTGRVPGLKDYGTLAALDLRTDRIVWQRRMPAGVQGGSGVTATAGGLLLHGDPDGTLQAYDSASGTPLWQFQTGASVNGPVSVYQAGGQQFIATTTRSDVWAFALGGALPPAAAKNEAPVALPDFLMPGRVERTQQVAMAGEVRDMGLTGDHRMQDEHALLPQRIRIQAGSRVTWTNKGKEPHRVAALDGTWISGLAQPGQSVSVWFDKPGTYAYQCREHPWSYGEITVE